MIKRVTELFNKVINNAILMSWARDLVKFGTPIFVIPLVVVVYNDIEQNFFFITSTIIGFALLADSGFGSVTTRAVAYFKAGAKYLPSTKKEYDESEVIIDQPPNYEQLTALYTTTKRIYYILNSLLVLIMATGGVAWIWNIMEQGGHRTDLWLAYFLLIPYCALLIGNVRLSAFIRGLDFVAKEASFSTLINALKIIVFIILLSFKLPPVYLSIIYIIEGIATRIFLRTFITNWFKEHHITDINKSNFSKPIFRSLWTASWRLAGIMWGNFFVEQGNTIIVAQISDTKLMANFLLTFRLQRIILGFSKTPVFAKIPTIFKLAAEKKKKELQETTSRYMFLGLTMAVISFAVLGLLGNYGFQLLHSDRRLLPFALFTIMAITEMLDMHSSFHASVYTSTNHIPFFFPSIISGAFIFLAGFFYIMPLYGIAGIIILRFLAQLAFNNWYAVYLNLKFLHWPFLNYLYEMPYYGFQWLVKNLPKLLPKKSR